MLYMNETLDQLDFFYAYDMGLITFLRKKGFRYVVRAKHIKTDSIFAVFVVTDELNTYLGQWKEIQK